MGYIKNIFSRICIISIFNIHNSEHCCGAEVKPCPCVSMSIDINSSDGKITKQSVWASTPNDTSVQVCPDLRAPYLRKEVLDLARSRVSHQILYCTRDILAPKVELVRWCLYFQLETLCTKKCEVVPNKTALLEFQQSLRETLSVQDRQTDGQMVIHTFC